jgi:hypothetical protein
VPIAPENWHWIWASGHNGHIRRAAHGYEATREGCDGGVREELARPMIATGITAVNWRKGLLWLWLVLSLCWIAGVGVYAWKHEPGISSLQFGYEIASSPEKQNEKEIVGSLSAELAKRYVAYVLLPPLITLALGLSAHGRCRALSAKARRVRVSRQRRGRAAHGYESIDARGGDGAVFAGELGGGSRAKKRGNPA